MNLKELILFGMEESQEPVIKNPILQAALREPRPMAQGGRPGFQSGQLVDHGPGRQGYQGKKENLYNKSPKFQKFLKEQGDTPMRDILSKYERILSKEGKIVGVDQLAEFLGKDQPYANLKSQMALGNTPITKNMSKQGKAEIKSAQKVRKIVIDTIGEGVFLGDIQSGYQNIKGGTGTTKTQVWNKLSKSQINKLNKNLNKHYKTWGLLPKTIGNIFDIVDNPEFMKALKNYTGGPIDTDSILFKTVMKAGKGDIAYGFMQLGRAYQGKIEVEGINKDKRLGNKIIKMMAENAKGDQDGPMMKALRKWSKFQISKYYDDPKTSYETLAEAIRKGQRDAGLTKTVNGKVQALLDIDEIFPLKSGQSTIGKGSGAYNNFIQLIDSNINAGAKRGFDSGATKRYQNIIEARNDALKATKKGDVVKAEKLWEKVNNIVKDHKTKIDEFYINNPEAKGKVKLTQLNYNPKTHTFASPTEIYGEKVLPSKIQKDVDKFYRKTGLSLDVGTTQTLEGAAKKVKKVTSTKNWRKSVNSAKAQTLAKALELKGIKICSGNAEGGRIGFGKGTQCGVKLAADNPNLFMKMAQNSKEAMNLFASGKIKPFLMQAKNWAGKNMGPTGWIGGELLVIGLGGAYEMTQGKGWKEALDTWTGLGGHFGMSEKRLKEIGKEQGWSEQQVYDAMKFQKLLALSQEGEEKEWELEGLLEQQDIGGTARVKYDPKQPGAYKPTQGQYQDPEYLRNLKKEVPEIWKEGEDLYKTLMRPQSSAALLQELQDRKKYEELEKKNKYWAWTKKHPGIGQQLEAPDPSDLGPFERSPGHPGYTGAFTNWKPYAGGGRVAFGAGGIDKGRRAFMQWIAGLTGAGIAAGTGLLKWGKVAGKGKTIVKAGDHIIQGTSGLPDWYIPLVNKIVKEGTDVTKKLGTVEREIVHTKSISKTEDITVYRNLDTGNVRVEYGTPEFDKTGKVIRASNDPGVVHLEYRAPEVIEEGAMKGKKTKSEFSAAESEPEVVNWDGDIEMSGIHEVNKVDDLVTDTSKLKEFGTGKKLTHKDKVIAKKKQKYKTKLEKDPSERLDYIENKGGYMEIDDILDEGARVGDFEPKSGSFGKGINLPDKKIKKASGGRVSYFDGGIVSLKKKW